MARCLDIRSAVGRTGTPGTAPSRALDYPIGSPGRAALARLTGRTARRYRVRCPAWWVACGDAAAGWRRRELRLRWPQPMRSASQGSVSRLDVRPLDVWLGGGWFAALAACPIVVECRA